MILSIYLSIPTSLSLTLYKWILHIFSSVYHLSMCALIRARLASPSFTVSAPNLHYTTHYRGNFSQADSINCIAYLLTTNSRKPEAGIARSVGFISPRDGRRSGQGREAGLGWGLWERQSEFLDLDGIGGRCIVVGAMRRGCEYAREGV